MGGGGGQVSTPNLVKDTWYHVVFTHNSTNSSLYLDGVLVDTNTAVDTTGESSGGFNAIGKFPLSTVGFMKGNIDDVRIWNRTLNADEVAELYELGTLNKETSLGSVYYKKYVATRSLFAKFANVLLDLYVGRDLIVVGDLTAGTIQASDGFTGNWDNFEGDTVTVVGGIITSVEP